MPSIVCFPHSFQETIGSSTLEFLLNENISESFSIMIDCSFSWALQEKPNELKKKKKQMCLEVNLDFLFHFA
jgi:hypothetical protein